MQLNLLIARALVGSRPSKTVLLLAEGGEASPSEIPRGVDCLSMPPLCRVPTRQPSYLDGSMGCVAELRTKILRAALESFEPDVLVVDHLPRGVAGELDEALDRLRARSRTRCVLGLRDVLDEPRTVRREWDRSGVEQAIRDFYDAVWIYGDPQVYDPVREYALAPDVAAKVRYTGYLDHRARFGSETPSSCESPAGLELPAGRIVLCFLGEGPDVELLAEAFAETRLPKGRLGLIVTGPYLSEEGRERLRKLANPRSEIRVTCRLPDPSLLSSDVESVIATGDYSTTWEALSLGKRTLLVPRMRESREQWIRAERLEALGFVDVLSPQAATPSSLANWLARRPKTDDGRPASSRRAIALDGLERLPALFDEVLLRPKPAAATGLW
jgi:predicted glycosyltransferase